MELQYLNISKVQKVLHSLSPIEAGAVYHIATIPAKNVGVTLAVDYDESSLGNNNNVEITAYDRAIMDAMYTLYVTGCTTPSMRQIAHALYAAKKLDATDSQREQIKASIEKLRQVYVVIDCSGECKYRKTLSDTEFAGALLPVEPMEDGGYCIVDIGPTYRYAECLHQIANVSTGLLQAGCKRNDTETMLLRRYLIERIEGMKNRRNHLHNNRITLEWWDHKRQTTKGLLPYLGYDKADYAKWRQKRYKLCQAICLILDDLTVMQYIGGYTIVRQGRTIIGFDLRICK